MAVKNDLVLFAIDNRIAISITQMDFFAYSHKLRVAIIHIKKTYIIPYCCHFMLPMPFGFVLASGSLINYETKITQITIQKNILTFINTLKYVNKKALHRCKACQ